MWRYRAWFRSLFEMLSQQLTSCGSCLSMMITWQAKSAKLKLLANASALLVSILLPRPHDPNDPPPPWFRPPHNPPPPPPVAKLPPPHPRAKLPPRPPLRLKTAPPPPISQLPTLASFLSDPCPTWGLAALPYVKNHMRNRAVLSLPCCLAQC